MKNIILILIGIIFTNFTFGFTKVWDFSNSGDYNVSNFVEIEFSGGMGNLKKIKLPSIYSENYNSDFEFQAGPEYFSISSNIYSGGTTFQISGGYSLLESKNYFPVDPNFSYDLGGFFKSLGSTLSKVFFGYHTFDKDKNDISAAESLTYGQGIATIQSFSPNQLVVTNSSDLGDWATSSSYDYTRLIGFYYDGNTSKLPDYVHLYTSANDYGVYQNVSGNTINLTKTLPSSVVDKIIPGTTKIRNQSSGGTFVYNVLLGNSISSNGGVFTGTISGEGLNTYSKFRPETKYVKLLLLANHMQYGSGINLNFDDINMISSGTLAKPYSWLQPYIQSKPISLTGKMLSFQETLGNSNQGNTRYQISLDGGTSWKIFSGGNWINIIGAQGNGTHSQARLIDEGNTASEINSNLSSLSTSGSSFVWRSLLNGDGTQMVSIDQINTIVQEISSTPILSLDLATGSDSGASNIDNLTNIKNSTFVGNCQNTSGNVISLYVSGVLTSTGSCNSGTFSIPVNLNEGNNIVYFTQDLDGNLDQFLISQPSPSLNVILDTKNPIFGAINFSGTKNYVKAGDVVGITLSLSGADSWSGGNNLSFSIGSSTGLNSGNFTFSSTGEIYRNRNYTILSGQNGTFSFNSIRFFDYAGNSITGFVSPYILNNVIVDTTFPNISFDDDVSSTKTNFDTIKISVSEINADTSSYKYGFSSDNVCDGNDSYTNGFVSGSGFVISDSLNNGKYICVISKDLAGNISYKSSLYPLNINSGPSDISLSNSNVGENTTGVGFFSTSDLDSSGFTYTISGADSSKFLLSGNFLSFINTPDFENPTGSSGNTYNIFVRSTDELGKFFEKYFSINVLDANEAPSVNSGNFSILENSSNGTFVGALSGFDVDTTSPNNSLSYQIISGNDNNAFSISTSGAIFVSSNLDFETKNIYNLIVQISDAGSPSLSSSSQVVINILDIDEISPETYLSGTISSGSISNNPNQTFNFSSSENGSFECRLDSGNWFSCSDNYSSNFSDGIHLFEVRSIDQAGNIDSSPASISFSIDTQKPVVEILTQNNMILSGTSMSLDFSGSDNTSIGKYECQVGTGNWFECSSPYSLSGLQEGNNIISLRASDITSNVSDIKSINVLVDTTAATLVLTGGTNLSTQNFEFSSSENGTFYCQLDSGNFEVCDSPKSYSDLVDGEHIFSLKFVDSAGNQTIETKTFVVDMLAPTFPSCSASPNPSNGGAVSIKCLQVESGANILLSGATCSPNPSNGQDVICSGNGLDIGQNPILTISDIYSNQATGVVDLIIDNISPIISGDFSIIYGSITNQNSINIDISASENLSYECDLDGNITSCSNPINFSDLSDGNHSLSIVGIDQAGNKSNILQNSWQIDTLKPQLTGLVATPSGISSGNISFDFSSSENGTFYCSLDGNIFEPCSSTKTYSNLANGNHSFEVKIFDIAGNESNIGKYDFVVDSSQPLAPSCIFDPRISNGGNVNIVCKDSIGTIQGDNITCSQSGGDIVCHFDAQNVGSYPNLTYIDELGKSITFSGDFVFDNIAPDKPVIIFPIETNFFSGKNLTYSSSYEPLSILECQIDGGVFGPCPSSFDLGDGVHTLNFRVVDQAGNISDIFSYTYTQISVSSSSSSSFSSEVSSSSLISSSSSSFQSSSISQSSSSTSAIGGGGGGWSNYSNTNYINPSSSISNLNSNLDTNLTTNLDEIVKELGYENNSSDYGNLKNINGAVFNPTISAGCYNPIDESTIYQNNDVSNLFRVGHQMFYSYGLTVYRGTLDYRPNEDITREQAAKFFTQFAINVLCRKPSYEYKNNFVDLKNADPTLKDYVKMSYEYGIFQGNGDGTFRPQEKISQDELLAIMARLATNKYFDSKGYDWAQSYKAYIQKKSKKYLYSTERENLAETLYSLYRDNVYIKKPVGYVIK